METNKAWELVATQERWLRKQLSTVRLPAGVSSADVLSELRIELYRAFLRYDQSKAKPSTLTSCVFNRKALRIIKRLTSKESGLTDEPLAPEPDLGLQRMAELRASGSLSEIEQYALNQLERFGKLTLTDLRKRWPGEFAFGGDHSRYVANLLNGIREKL